MEWNDGVGDLSFSFLCSSFCCILFVVFFLFSFLSFPGLLSFIYYFFNLFDIRLSRACYPLLVYFLVCIRGCYFFSLSI